MDIGIISEGITDQIIIEAIIQGYLDNKDISLDPLQPKKNQPGGWPLVFEYVKSKDFQESLPYNDGITIIQIDCDVLKGAEIPDEIRMEFNNLNNLEIYDMVKNKFIEFIGLEIYEKCSDKIIFAITIDVIECWFLPLYFPTKKAICNKTTSCIKTVNPELIRNHDFYIDAKNPEHYRLIAKAYTKKKAINHCYQRNDNFAHFIDNLEGAFLAQEEGNILPDA